MDMTGSGEIDFQEFIAAAVNRKLLTNQTEVKKAFDMLDCNGDGKITVEDFNDLFCSYAGAKMDSAVWEQLLSEADANGNGVVSEDEFAAAMNNIIRNSIKHVKKKKTRPRHTEKLPAIYD